MKNLITRLVCMLLLISAHVVSAQKTDRFWQAVDQNEVLLASRNRGADEMPLPKEFKAFRLDTAAMRAELAKAPLYNFAGRNPHSNCVITLPMPDGGMEEFEVYEAPVMEPELGNKYPNIKSYLGVSIREKSIINRFCYSNFGLSSTCNIKDGSYVFSESMDKNKYQIVYNNENSSPVADFNCNTISSKQLMYSNKYSNETNLNTTVFYKYRLALACTGEYANYHGGTKSAVIAAFNSTMTRVNGVFEREFGIHMDMVANNDTLIFFNKNSDPYKNDEGGKMLLQNQVVCDSRIGKINYDIGHVFSTGGGGVAILGSVCDMNEKAMGVTGRANPKGDGFDIDFVSHEMGHQFGANHTFAESGITKENCSKNINLATAVEPSSGTTIMGYAGVCKFNIQNHSDAYFSTISIGEIRNHLVNVFTCGLKTATNNELPTVSLPWPVDINIPKMTPFVLSGEAMDDGGPDALKLNWEQIDADSIKGGLPSNDQKSGPTFRSKSPDAEGKTRYFPDLYSLMTKNSQELQWEKLPNKARALNFRLTARDGFGGIGDKDIKLNVIETAGPFKITSPSLNSEWVGGTTKNISWDVANTDQQPISCEFVDIYIVDPDYIGLDFANPENQFDRFYFYKMASSVPNIGNAEITVPDLKINRARLMIKPSLGNGVFYAISNSDIKITPRLQTFELSTNQSHDFITPGGVFNYLINVNSISGFEDIVHLDIAGLPQGFSYSFFPPGQIHAGGSVTIFVSCAGNVLPGDYNILLIGEAVIGGYKQRKYLPLSFTVPSYAFLDDKKINCIAQAKDGTIFAGTDEGIWRFTGVNFEQLIISGALINKYLITDMAADTSGGIWVATRGRTGTSNPLTAAPAGRVFYFKNPAANPMTTGDFVEWGSQAGNGGLQSRYTTSIDVDGKKVWTAHYYQTKIDGFTFDLAGGMSVLNYANPTPQPLFTPVTAGLPTIPTGNSCYYRNCDALAARFDETWLVSRANETGCSTVVPNGIYHYKNGTFQQSWLPDNLSDPAAKALLTDAYPRAAFTDRLKNTWIGFVNNTPSSSARGLLVFPPDANMPIALSDCYFPATASISRNAIWEDNVLPFVYVGTNIGLMIINSADVESTSNYLFYNALESNQTIPIIRGGMVDKEGSIWLATDNGVIRTTFSYLRNTTGPPSLSSEPIRLDIVNHNLSYKLTSNNDGYPIASLKELKANLADTLFSVATDGTDTWFVVTGTDVQDVEVKIVGTPSDQGKFGYFEVLSATAGKKVFKYHHPTYLNNDERSIGVEVRNPKSCAGVLKYKFTVKFVAPPVLLLHGLWSEGEGCWKEMKEGLKDRGYPSFMVSAPSYPNDKPFVNNIPLIPVFVTNLLKQCALSKVSTSKADLVGHSMGGIMSRLYLQSPKYHNDIHKIITIDTPHSGSQGANVIVGSPGVVQQILALTGMDPTQGAVADLRVNSTAIDNLLNGTRLNAHIVPSHSISSEKTVLEDIVDYDCSFPPVLYLIPGVNDFLSELELECQFTQFVLASAPEGLTVDDFIRNTIYGGEPSDLVVAESSQKGGLTDPHTSGFYDLSHMEIQHNKSTIDWVYYLLRAKTDAEEFAQTGFMPKPLEPLIPSEIDDRDPMSGTVDITQPAPGALYTAGAEVNIKATATGDINKIIVTMGNANIPIQTKVVYANSADLTFTIPISAIGRVNIVAAGYKNNQFIHLDTSWINVNTAANLDSLKIGDGYAVVPIDHNLPIQIKGYYDDGTVRDVTTQAGMQFNSQLGRVSFTAPNLKGLVVGADTLSFTLSGKTALLAVEVDSIAWIDPDSTTTSVQQPVARPSLKTSKLNAYPNPFNEIISLQIPGNSASFSADLVIFNTLGQPVFTEKNVAVRGEKAFSCDLSRLPEGLYYLLLTTPQGPYSTKITKHGGR
jgi:pimeloyl-ACP methyl ester carboxylesterase